LRHGCCTGFSIAFNPYEALEWQGRLVEAGAIQILLKAAQGGGLTARHVVAKTLAKLTQASGAHKKIVDQKVLPLLKELTQSYHEATRYYGLKSFFWLSMDRKVRDVGTMVLNDGVQSQLLQALQSCQPTDEASQVIIIATLWLLSRSRNKAAIDRITNDSVLVNTILNLAGTSSMKREDQSMRQLQESCALLMTQWASVFKAHELLFREGIVMVLIQFSLSSEQATKKFSAIAMYNLSCHKPSAQKLGTQAAIDMLIRGIKSLTSRRSKCLCACALGNITSTNRALDTQQAIPGLVRLLKLGEVSYVVRALYNMMDVGSEDGDDTNDAEEMHLDVILQSNLIASLNRQLLECQTRWEGGSKRKMRHDGDVDSLVTHSKDDRGYIRRSSNSAASRAAQSLNEAVREDETDEEDDDGNDNGAGGTGDGNRTDDDDKPNTDEVMAKAGGFIDGKAISMADSIELQCGAMLAKCSYYKECRAQMVDIGLVKNVISIMRRATLIPLQRFCILILCNISIEEGMREVLVVEGAVPVVVNISGSYNEQIRKAAGAIICNISCDSRFHKVLVDARVVQGLVMLGLAASAITVTCCMRGLCNLLQCQDRALLHQILKQDAVGKNCLFGLWVLASCCTL